MQYENMHRYLFMDIICFKMNNNKQLTDWCEMFTLPCFVA